MDGNGHLMERAAYNYRSALSGRSPSDGASQGPNSSCNLSKNAFPPHPYSNPDKRAMLAKRCEKSDQGDHNGLSLVPWPSSDGSSRSQWSHGSMITTVEGPDSLIDQNEVDVYRRAWLINQGFLLTTGELPSIEVIRKLAGVLKHLYRIKNGAQRVYAPLVELIIPSAWSHQNQSGFSIKQVIDSLEILSKPHSTTPENTKYCKDIVLFAFKEIANMPLITDKAIKDTEICASVINEQRRLKKMMLDYLEIHYSDNLPITITHPMTYRSETIDIQTVKNDCAKQGCVEPLPLSHQLRLSALEKEQPRSYQR